MEERAERLAQYIIENRTTVRAAAQEIRHQQIHSAQGHLRTASPSSIGCCAQQVKEVLEVNKAQRHIRGGIATRKKYRGE